MSLPWLLMQAGVAVPLSEPVAMQPASKVDEPQAVKTLSQPTIPLYTPGVCMPGDCGPYEADLVLPYSGWFPFARTLLTSDPDMSVPQVLNRMQGEVSEPREDLLTSAKAECGTVNNVKLPEQYMSLVYDKRKPTLGIDPKEMTDAALLEFETSVKQNLDPNVAVDDISFASVIDNHDGITSVGYGGAVNSTGGMFDDVGSALCYPTYPCLVPTQFMLRGYIPATIFTWESPGSRKPKGDLTSACGQSDRSSLISKCRLYDVDLAAIGAGFTKRPWWKSTVTTNDIFLSRDFATKLLLGKGIHSSYPEPYDRPAVAARFTNFTCPENTPSFDHGVNAKFSFAPDECLHKVAWAVFNVTQPTDSEPSYFMMHFVQSLEGTMKAINEKVSEERNLGDGIFDRWMHNSLVIKVDSFTPYYQRLKELGVAYVVRTLNDCSSCSGSTCPSCLFALFVGIPGSALAFQLQAPAGDTTFDFRDTPRHDMCSTV